MAILKWISWTIWLLVIQTKQGLTCVDNGSSALWRLTMVRISAMMVMHVIAITAIPSSTGFNCSLISLYKHTHKHHVKAGVNSRRNRTINDIHDRNDETPWLLKYSVRTCVYIGCFYSFKYLIISCNIQKKKNLDSTVSQLWVNY